MVLVLQREHIRRAVGITIQESIVLGLCLGVVPEEVVNTLLVATREGSEVGRSKPIVHGGLVMHHELAYRLVWPHVVRRMLMT